MTSGAHVLPRSAHFPTCGRTSPAGVHSTRSGEVSSGTFSVELLVPYAYQVASTSSAPGSGKLSEYTGLVKVTPCLASDASDLSTEGVAGASPAEQPPASSAATSSTRHRLTTCRTAGS